MDIRGIVEDHHATADVKAYCLYMYYFMGVKRAHLARSFKKSKSTIQDWIDKYEETGLLGRSTADSVYKKFGVEKRKWLVDLYESNPMLTLAEARHLFQVNFRHTTISKSSICLILREAGLTWKVIERRAMQVSEAEVVRFARELLALNWTLTMLVFLDEVSFDNRDMLRKHGYGRKGEALVYRGEFNRRPRVSLLCFLGLHGVLDTFLTEGTFDRHKFADCCRDFALNNENVHQYPGPNSIWILDGAKIHCDKNLTAYLRSLGIVVIFLPAYCPFFNPIEVLFGMVKQRLQKYYVEGSNRPLEVIVSEVLNMFLAYNFTAIFRKCGYSPSGFDAATAFKQDLKDFGFEEAD